MKRSEVYALIIGVEVFIVLFVGAYKLFSPKRNETALQNNKQIVSQIQQPKTDILDHPFFADDNIAPQIQQPKNIASDKEEKNNLVIAENYFRNNNHELAIKHYDLYLNEKNSAQDEINKISVIYFNNGKNLFYQHNYDNAKIYFSKAINLNKEYITNLKNIIENFHRSNDVLPFYDLILAYQPNNTDILQKKADFYFNQKNYQEALTIYKQIVDLDHKYLNHIDQQTQKLLKMKLLKEYNLYIQVVASFYKKFNKQDSFSQQSAPDNTDNANNIQKQNKNIPAETSPQKFVFTNENFKDIKSIPPSSKTTPQNNEPKLSPNQLLLTKYIERSHYLIDNKNYKDALFEINEALNIKQDDIEALTLKGNALLELQRYENALEVYDKLLSIKNNNEIFLANKAYCLYKLYKFNEAIELSENMLRLFPQNYDAYLIKGLIYKKNFDYANAVTNFDNAIKINPSRGIAWFHKGMIYYQANDIANAKNCFQNFLKKISSNNEELQYKKEAIAMLKNFDTPKR